MTYVPAKPWHPGGAALHASSPDYFTIIVYDDFVGRLNPLRPAKKTRWRKVRDAALADWSQAGLRFAVTEGNYRWLWPDSGEVNHDLELFGQFERGSIVLRRKALEGAVGTGQYIDTYGTSDEALGICTFDAWAVENLRSGMMQQVRGVICHEVGHVLGFGHNGFRADPPGDSNVGVMAYGYGGADISPSEEELEAVHGYYFGA